MNGLRRALAAAAMLASGAWADTSVSGHIKYRLGASSIPAESALREEAGSSLADQAAEVRLNAAGSSGAWLAEAAYRLVAEEGDSIGLAGNAHGELQDNRRLFDLADVVSSGDRRRLHHRLDRVLFGWRSVDAVVKLGRQAVSWGNGLFFAPMDFFNPFAPQATDTEYKSGDDMAYGQYLFADGSDLQAVWVLRRDEDGNTGSGVNSIAGKLHGFAGTSEYDLLLARHYGDTIFAVGGVADVGEALWRADAVLASGDDGDFVSLVTSLSYSWVGFGRNMSGGIEYFRNGYGTSDGNYSEDALEDRPALSERISRGELFALGRDYLAAGLTVETHPLLNNTANVFWNLSDRSALLQLVSSYDAAAEWNVLGSLAVPIGPPGSEYGGVRPGTDDPDAPLSYDWSISVQVARYF